MQERPEDTTPPSADEAVPASGRSRPSADEAVPASGRSRRRLLVWALPVAPLLAALALVSWPHSPATTTLTADASFEGEPRAEVLAAVFPTDVSTSAVGRGTAATALFGPSDELAETADLLSLRLPEPAPAAGSGNLDGDHGVAGPPPVAAPATSPPSSATAAPEPTPEPRPTPNPAPTVVPTAVPTATPVPAPAGTATATPTEVAGPPVQPAESAAVSLLPREALLLVAMNNARVAAGLAPVTARADLTGVARARSEEMVRMDYFAHFHPGGHSAYELLANAGLTFSAAGENLVKTFGDVQHSVDIGFEALWGSPTHRANILKPVYTQVGVGSFTSDDGLTIITTIFTDR